MSAVILAPSGRPARSELRAQWAYEAAQYSRKRSMVFAPLQDSHKDLDGYTLGELAKHSKNLWRNSPLIRGLIERLVTFTVGIGIYPTSNTSNPEWSARANKVIARFTRRPALYSRSNFGQWQRTIARTRFLQGGAFSIKTYDRGGRPKLQSLPPHRIKGGPKEAVNGRTYSKGDVKTYWIDATLDGAESKPYAAENVIHHFSPMELGQRDGEPILAAAIDTARDVKDILAFEKEAVKDASSKKDVIQTGTGELEADEEEILRTGGTSPEDPAAYYQKKTGAETFVLRWGDEYKPYIPQRPGPAWSGFMEFLANTVCLSANIPPPVLLPIKLGGAADRRDLAAAGRTFEIWQEDLIAECQEAIEYVLQCEIDDGPLINPPDDWNELDWQPPKHITVDMGREAASDRADVQSALMTRREYWGRQGQNGERQELQIVKEAVRRKQMIEAEKMTVREFIELCSLDPKLFSSAKVDDAQPVPA